MTQAEPRDDPHQPERVLVVPRAAVLPRRAWRGLRDIPLESLRSAIATSGRYLARPDAEADPSFKQIIPYLIVRDGPRWFLMHRTRAGADARLYERFSLGVGGHLNPEDGDLESGLRREWQEEIDADFVPEFRFVGLLN